MVLEKHKYSPFLFIFLWLSIDLSGQPAGYYDNASGLTGTALQQALHDIIDNHSSVTYDNLWTSFQVTDKRPDGKVWDMYSDIPSGTPAYSFIFVTNQCGNYDSEGDCYNREHSFPKSWFGGEVYPMYSDLFHLYPTDGWVNNKRGNYPFGTTSSPTWTSTNGSKLGPCSYSGYSGTVFEPVNAYKGDFARSYFYMAVRYFGEDALWPGSEMVTGSQLKSWALRMLMDWDISDPVDLKEKDRNETVFNIQGNRNPFIDNTSFANQIWGSQVGVEEISSKQKMIRILPNPANETATIELNGQISEFFNIRILNAAGKIIMNKSASGSTISLDITAFADGYYIVLVSGKNMILYVPLIVAH